MRILIVSALMLISAIAVANHNRGHVDVKIGDLSEKGQYGQQVFNQNCAACHGVNAQGTQSGPPLIHSIYNPGHHSNEAFYRAIKNGVQQHHWPYGNMPSQPQVGFMEMTALLVFIRETQKYNGIKTQEHKM
ncbi:c-type cytochrome [Gynuella sp.]|uniref:c-type cytochrome n=1 Tax=Gynuella sp. TaxID=2969146 RepID=UPI003D12C992